MTPVVGNTAAQEAFAAALASGHLHHAWLLAGPQGVGKGTFARRAAADLVGGGAQRDALIAGQAHPDHLVIKREPWTTGNTPRIVPLDERKGDETIARSIRMEQIQALVPMLAMRPSLGARRAIVIDSVDDLEAKGANALLKNLEEPPQGTVFLLVSHTPGRLLPTIRSRCRRLRFGLLRDAEMGTVLHDVDPSLSHDEAAALVRAGEGSPGRALGFAGLEIGKLDAAIEAIAADGDPDNARRAALGRSLGLKAAQARYEAFLDRAPAFIASCARDRRGPALQAVLDLQARARDLARAALGLSLEPQATVWEMAGLLAALPRG